MTSALSIVIARKSFASATTVANWGLRAMTKSGRRCDVEADQIGLGIADTVRKTHPVTVDDPHGVRCRSGGQQRRGENGRELRIADDAGSESRPGVFVGGRKIRSMPYDESRVPARSSKQKTGSRDRERNVTAQFCCAR